MCGIGERILANRKLFENMPSSINSDKKASYLILNGSTFSYHEKSLHISTIVDTVFFSVQNYLKYTGDNGFYYIGAWLCGSTLQSLSELIKGSRNILERHCITAGRHFISQNQPNAAQFFLRFVNPSLYREIQLLCTLRSILEAENTDEARSCLSKIRRLCSETGITEALYSYFKFFISKRGKDACLLAYKRMLLDFGATSFSETIIDNILLKKIAYIFLKATVDSCDFSLAIDFQNTFCKTFEYDDDFIVWKDIFQKEHINFKEKQRELTYARDIQHIEELIVSKQYTKFLLYVEKLYQMGINLSTIRAMSDKIFTHLGKNDEVHNIIQLIISIPIPIIQVQIIDALYYRLLGLCRNKEALYVLFYIPNDKDKNNRLDSFLSNLHYDLDERQMLISLSQGLNEPLEQFETLCLSIGLL
jgi:hypothetical protein